MAKFFKQRMSFSGWGFCFSCAGPRALEDFVFFLKFFFLRYQRSFSHYTQGSEQPAPVKAMDSRVTSPTWAFVAPLHGAP